MARVPVPADTDRAVVTVAGTHDHLYGEADVNLDDQRHARHVKLGETDADGTVGVPEQYADAVADVLGTTVESPGSGDDGEDTADGESETDGDPFDDADGCPWCDEYDGEHAKSHASSAHPDEWDAYKTDD